MNQRTREDILPMFSTTYYVRAACILGFAALLSFPAAAADSPGDLVYYVAVDGNDAYSGKLPSPNAEKTDGPFATITRARDAIRARKTAPGGIRQPVTVQVRGGTYYISQTITLTPEDSGTKEYPVCYTAYPGEKPVLSGGRRITGWHSDDGKLYHADLPEVKAGKWFFRQLCVDGLRRPRARFPNLHPTEPLRKGFLYADSGGFGMGVHCIHNPGDWMEYKIRVPADGTYALWVFYGAKNQPFGRSDMGGRTTISIDAGPAIPVMNLPDTGGWADLKWSRSASVALKAGPRVMKWQNVKGGGLDLDAFALCDDPNWKPTGMLLKPPAPGTHRLVVQAEDFVASHGPQLRVGPSGGGPQSKVFIPCKPGTAKPAWAQAPDGEIHIFQSGSCRAFMEIVQIKSVDTDGAGIHVTGKECITKLRSGDRFFVENVFEELDAPGEWYLDRAQGRLYYRPVKTPPEGSTVIGPVVGRLFALLGDPDKKKAVEHVRISGFEFRANDYSPDDGCEGYKMGREGTVHLQEANHCRIENNRFVNIGKYAVCLAGGRGNRVADNDVAHGAEGGVLLLDSAANVVTNNHIHHVGVVYKHIGGVVLQGPGSSENVVTHNLIHDSSRYGITLKNAGSRNAIEYNELYDLNTETFDTGGIEVTQHQRTFRSGSTIRHNIVHDVGGYSSVGTKPIYMSWGIYLDSFAGGYEVSHNVVWGNSHGGLMIQGGKDNYAHNNIFVDGTRQQVQLNNFMENSTGNRFLRNIVYYTEPEAVLIAAYRHSKEATEADYNVYWHAGGKPLMLRLSGGLKPLAEWQKDGLDTHSVVADPRFVDPAGHDYSLQPDSPARKLGFEPIDTSQVGLQR